MVFKVQIGTGVDTLQLLEAHWKVEVYITGGISIVRQFHMVMEAIFGRVYTQVQMPFDALCFPVFIPLLLRAGANKKLHFHLLKFSHTENEASGHNLITESFANLCNAKRNFHSGRFLHIQKVYKDALCRFRT